jgi:vacuolar protein sorting-associated protein 26
MYIFLVPNVYNESETITKFEIMDGAPVRGKKN